MISTVRRRFALMAAFLLVTALFVAVSIAPAGAGTDAFNVAIYVGGDTSEPCVALERGQPGDCRVMVHQSTPGSTISVSVWDSAAKGSLLDSFDVPTEANGFGWIGGGGLDPGTYVEVTDGVTTASADVPALSAVLDLATDTVSGVAAPNSSINATVIAKDGTHVCSRDVPVDGSGAWSADFTTPVDSPGDPGCAQTHSFSAGDWAQLGNNDVIDFGSFQTVVQVVDFTDDEGSVFESDITWLADQGITRGCNPPVNDQFCPDDPVTRGQMAAFMVRALGLTDDGGGNSFTDDDGSVFEVNIAKLAAAGITRGCNPPVNDKFCPDDPVTRGQMAAFMKRALS
jgi:hypothetical protein